MIKKVIYTDDNKLMFVKDTSKDFHTHRGVISKDNVKKNGIIETNKSKKVILLDANMSDNLKSIKRGAAIILPKDAGYIIAETGLNKDSRVLEAGTGSAALTICMANVCKQVYTYENNEKHFKISKQNIEDLNLKNVTLNNKDLKESKEKDIDLVVLDLPQPWDYLDIAYSSLKQGAFLVTYLPTITQVQELIKNADPDKFKHIKTVEIIEREWHIDGKKVRPKSQMIAHTAFLSFLRKI